MKKIATVLVCLLMVNILPALNNFKPAIIIDLNNDTIKGFVDFRSDNLNATECRFKASENDSVKRFLPGEIAGYMFDKLGKNYVSHTITIDSLIQETVFLEILVLGTINLYSYQDIENNDHYYFEKAKNELVEVTKKRDKVSNVRFKVENTWYSSTSNYDKNLSDEKYKKVLASVFKESSRVSDLVGKVAFQRKDFIKLTSRYNTEMGKNGTKNIVVANENFNTFFDADFSLDAGVQYADYKSIPEFSIQNYSIASQSLMPVISGQMTLTNPRVIKSVSLIVDLSLSRFTGASDYVSKYSTYYIYKYDGLRLGGGLGLKYTHITNTLCPFVEAALANSFFALKSSTFEAYDRYFDYEIKTNYFLPENVIGGYRLAIGCNYMLKNGHALVAKINYENLSDYKDKLTIFEFKLGYSF